MMNKTLVTICIVLLAAWLAGCPKPILEGYPSEGDQITVPEEASEQNPRAVASLQLTEQGRRLLDERQPDRAIRILEQAVSLHPTNGQNYYYLAEAWLMKGFADQAKEFNQLAEIHLKDDHQWMIRVGRQADRIAELEK
ncbi:MAG: tetratricopeptide repeat protein [Desulfobacterales bacterium]|jgi:tetratricopeptide (TPR) repeat protein